MSKDSFKIFVKKHPSLINYVKNNEMTWQKFYEIYDIYGEDNNVWDKYFSSTTTQTPSISLGDTSLKEIFNMVKKVDLNTVKRGVEGLQKVVGLAQDLANVKGNQVNTKPYQSRPIYKYFED